MLLMWILHISVAPRLFSRHKVAGRDFGVLGHGDLSTGPCEIIVQDLEPGRHFR